MAQYTVVTNREQEAALNYAVEHHASEGQSKAEFLQARVNRDVLNPMVVDWKRDQSVSLEKSIATIPEANEAKASTEIQTVIVDNGGTLVPVGPPAWPPPFPSPIPPVEPLPTVLEPPARQDEEHG